MTPDEDRMDAYYACSEAAFGELHDHYRVELHVYFFRRVQNRQTAEDLVQTVFQNIIRSKESAKGRFDRSRGSFRAWLFGIAAFALIDHFRKAGREPTFVADDPQGESFGDSGISLTDTAEVEEPSPQDQAAARECWEKMPADLRLVLELRVQRGLKVEEAAAILGCSNGQVSKREQRARAWFRNCMSGESLDDC